MDFDKGDPRTTGMGGVEGPLFALTGRGAEVKRARELIASIGGTLTSSDNRADYLVVVKGAGRRKVEDFCSGRKNRETTDCRSRVVLLDMLEEWSVDGALPKRSVTMEDVELKNLFSASSREHPRRSYEVPPSFLKRPRLTLDAEGSVVDEADNAVLCPSKRTCPQLQRVMPPSPSKSTLQREPSRDNTSPLRCGEAVARQLTAAKTNGKVNPMRMAFQRWPKPDWDTYFSEPPLSGSLSTLNGEKPPATDKPPLYPPRQANLFPRKGPTGSQAVVEGSSTKRENNGVVLSYNFNKENTRPRSLPVSTVKRPQRGTENSGSGGGNTKSPLVINKLSGTEKVTQRSASAAPFRGKMARGSCNRAVKTSFGEPQRRSEGALTVLSPAAPERHRGLDKPKDAMVSSSSTTSKPTALVSRPQLAPKIARTDRSAPSASRASPNTNKRSSLHRPSTVPTTLHKSAASIGRRSTLSDLLLQRVRQSVYCDGVSDEACATVLQQVVDRACPVNFDSIAGLDECKRILQETIILPAKCPQLFTGLRRPCNGLLLFGPPGNGKTLLAKAVANECDTTFLCISAAAITSKWVGESEKMVKALFSVARALSPSTIFIDEVDSVLQARGGAQEGEGSRRLKTEFLVQMDGAGNDTQEARVLVMGATNRPFDLDEAVIRRFPKRVYVPLPDGPTRAQILQKLLNTRETPNTLNAHAWETVVALTHGYSGHDLRQLCEEAAMVPVRELIAEKLRKGENLSEGTHDALLRPLTLADVESCVKGMNSSCCPKLLTALEEWNKSFGSK